MEIKCVLLKNMSSFILEFHLLGYRGLTSLAPIILLVKVPSGKGWYTVKGQFIDVWATFGTTKR